MNKETKQAGKKYADAIINNRGKGKHKEQARHQACVDYETFLKDYFKKQKGEMI